MVNIDLHSLIIALLSVVIIVVAITVQLVCLIIVVTKLLPTKGVLWGILGIVCGIYTFIWGWQNADRFELKNIMSIWSVAILVSLIVLLATRLIVHSG